MRTSSKLMLYGLTNAVIFAFLGILEQAYFWTALSSWAVSYAAHEDLVSPLHWHIVLRLKTEKL